MKRLPLIALLSLAMLQGCDRHGTSHEAAHKPAAGDAAPAAAPAGKPQAPIEIEWELLGTPKRDEPLTIRLEVGLAQGRTGAIDLAIRSDDGLELDAGSSAKSLTITAPAERVDVTIKVIPKRLALAYVHVIATLDPGDDSARVRAISIPVTTGDAGDGAARADQAGSLETDAEGQPLHVMPVEESDGKGG